MLALLGQFSMPMRQFGISPDQFATALIKQQYYYVLLFYVCVYASTHIHSFIHLQIKVQLTRSVPIMAFHWNTKAHSSPGTDTW